MQQRVAVIRGRLLAMETYSLPERLTLALEIMSAQRDSLAAKCALMSV